jgi:hypothetical protein
MPTRSSSFFIQGSTGTNGNFEVVVPRTGGGIAHLFRNNDDPGLPWTAPVIAFGSSGDITSVSLVESSYGSLEAVMREGNRLCHNFRDGIGPWSYMFELPGATAVSGAPGFIQGSFGSVGNYEVVAPLAAGGLAHWFRNNDNDRDKPWSAPFRFGSGVVEAVALLQSSFGTPGNLEVVARVGTQLVQYFRDAGGWHGPYPLASGVAGVPSFLQSRIGTPGNFELVSPLAAGGIAHWFRANDQPGFPWKGPYPVGSERVDAVGLVQNRTSGNLEVVARAGEKLTHYYRDATGWHGPYPLPADRPCTAAEGGWTIPFRSGAVAIHMALMRTGKLVVFGFDTDDSMGLSRVADPANGALFTPPATPMLFCSGHAFLPDGKLLVAGGHHDDAAKVHTFDPDTRTWTHRATMAQGRWYPTCTALPDGRTLIMSGWFAEENPVLNNSWQIYDAAAGALGPQQPLPSFANQPIELYPFVYVLPSGKVLVHSARTTRFFNPPPTGTTGGSWDATQLTTADTHARTWGRGSSVLLPLLPSASYRAKVLVLGGITDERPNPPRGTAAVATAEVLDLGAASPAWRSVASMAAPRIWATSTLLPDGTVLVTGGSAMDNDTPVFQAELFDPATERWTTLCSMRVPRLYHSTAVLLPDGRVLTAGKDGSRQPAPYLYPEYRCEVFSPPYLSKGPRPTFTGAPASAAYGASVTVQTPDAAAIGSVVLIRPGAVTHAFNMDQRLVGLTFTRGAGTITFKTPPNANLAPRGHYMLFLVSDKGVPSVATFLRLG